MHKKGAIGLSMNMLVVIIISLVILASGIAFLYRLIGGAEEIKGDLDRRTQQEIERILVEQGRLVALPFRQATIERGKGHVFGLGILNIGSPEEKFRISIGLEKVVNEKNEDITASVSVPEVEGWLLYDKDFLSIPENEQKSEGISVQVPITALPGQYLFAVEVLTEEKERYGNPQLMIVKVK